MKAADRPRAAENWICVLSVYEIQSANALAIKCNSKFVLGRCTWHHALPAEWLNGDNSVEQAERQTTDIQRPLTLTAHHRHPFHWAMTWISATLHHSRAPSLALTAFWHYISAMNSWKQLCIAQLHHFKGHIALIIQNKLFSISSQTAMGHWKNKGEHCYQHAGVWKKK